MPIFLWITGRRNLLRQIERVITWPSYRGMPRFYSSPWGFCFLTQLGCDTCRDAGESAVAAKVELAGRVAVLVLSMPLSKDTGSGGELVLPIGGRRNPAVIDEKADDEDDAA